MNIVVVESPSKAKTINKYLGSGYEVLASFGHIRDLPPKDGSVDPDNDFRMLWEVDAKSNQRINDIARALKGADKLILATDPDREGEAISWHVLEVLKEKKALKDQKIERVVFNAITKQAVTEAMKHPRVIDAALVDAYLARRALDYLVGFTLSPVLWRKLPGARSAGRVQSVALRLVCDRELEIEKFVAKEYWSILAKLATPRNEVFEARLVGADGQKIQRLDIGSGAEAEAFTRDLENAIFKVTSVEAKAGTAQSAAALHHLDHAAGGKPQARLRSGDRHAPRPAALRRRGDRRRSHRLDHLYAYRRHRHGAGGDCRHPRHAGPQLWQGIRPCFAARVSQQIEERAGGARSGAPDQRQPHARRSRQICRSRSGAALRIDLESRDREPDGIRRTRAHHGRHRRQGGFTQHRAARVRPGGEIRRLSHPLSGRPGRNVRMMTSRAACPRCRRAKRSASRRSKSSQHFTEPPPRFSEAALVKRMEELGIGRPSTYASILQVLQDRGYVRIDKKRLIPEDKGRVVVAFLESFFTRYVEYDFTAGLEEKLDEISAGKIDWRAVLAEFWEQFVGAVNEIKEVRNRVVLDALNDLLEPHIFPERADGTPRRQCPQCEYRPAFAEDRTLRGLRRLLELSGLQFHAADHAQRRRRSGQKGAG